MQDAADTVGQIDGGVQEDAAAEAVEESTEASQEAGAGQADQAAEVSQDLARQEDVLSSKLTNFERQLSRMESRLDRGQDPAALRQLRGEISELKGQLSGIAELRETVDAVLKRSMEPEEWMQFEAGRRATRAERELERTKAERDELAAARTVHVGAEPQANGQSANPPEVEAAAKEMDEIAMELGYDPTDAAFQKRVAAAVPGFQQMTLAQVTAAVSRAIVRFSKEDAAKAKETAERSQARGAVTAVRTRTEGAPAAMDDKAFLAAFNRGELNGPDDHKRAMRILGT